MHGRESVGECECESERERERERERVRVIWAAEKGYTVHILFAQQATLKNYEKSGK